MATPQMTLRVADNRLSRWRASCKAKGTSVSQQIRVLMDEWTSANPPEPQPSEAQPSEAQPQNPQAE